MVYIDQTDVYDITNASRFFTRSGNDGNDSFCALKLSPKSQSRRKNRGAPAALPRRFNQAGFSEHDHQGVDTMTHMTQWDEAEYSVHLLRPTPRHQDTPRHQTLAENPFGVLPDIGLLLHNYHLPRFYAG